MSYIHSGGRSPLITRSYQPSPVNSRHSSSSIRSNTLTKNKKVADAQAYSSEQTHQQENRSNLPLFKRFRVNNGPHNSHYAPSTNIITNPLMDRTIQSSLPSIMNDAKNCMKINKSNGSYQRLEVNAETDNRDNLIVNKRSPTSSVGDGDTVDYAQCDHVDGSNSERSHHTSEDEQEISYYAQADVARDQQTTGFTFNESSFVIEPQSQLTQNKRFHNHQRPNLPNYRSTSPYAIDSKISSAIQLNRHPKFRRKQSDDKPQSQQLSSPSSGTDYSHSSYENIIQSDFTSQQQKQIKVPTSMQNGMCKFSLSHLKS